ncbi:uncharacterized protein LOC114288670 isoform X2 [Camellia sinensis]|uniref:uncharacterized protein LOC114288670 isoform X2 n=1 Tax=Camellia sinensis TaxID=4442 RepID=UPI0010360A23|nr:uncharacterized protein LOC114288670 isoform X2 [Camellia sinensis]
MIMGASMDLTERLVFQASNCLCLNDNQLTGKIPRELTGISSLKVVDVSNNLCGTIPTTGPFEHIPLNKEGKKEGRTLTQTQTKIGDCNVYHVSLLYWLFPENLGDKPHGNIFYVIQASLPIQKNKGRRKLF